MVTDFLTQQWVDGALFGDTAEHAFRVRVDEIINPPSVTALGQLIVQVTIRPTTPAEFIVFQVIQDITGSTLQESTAA
jgi:phage tail sheath protein FI